MKRTEQHRPTFPFLGLALLLGLAAAVSAAFFRAELSAVFLGALSLLSLHLGTPAPTPARVQARATGASRYPR
jgi:hypothetical protein